jgi:hypothetical protein
MRAARTIVIVCLGAASLLVAVSVAAAQDKRPPFFATGTWKGQGTISSKIVTTGTSGLTIRTRGTIVFTLNVSETGHVSGTGTWNWNIVSYGPGLNSTYQGRAFVKLSGTTRAVKAAGKERQLGGVLQVDGQAAYHPRTPDNAFVTMLTITKMGPYFLTEVGPCKVSGTAGKGATWTAVNQRSGCV